MSAIDATNNGALEKDVAVAPQQPNNGTPVHPQMSAEEHEVARAAARFGYGPLAQVNTADAPLRPFGGEFQPGLYKPVADRKFANPAPLGLCAFALTTFILSAINMGAADISAPNIVVGAAFAYGGLVQLLAGMWYVILCLCFRRVEGIVFANCDVLGRWLSETLSVLPLCPHMAVSGLLLPSF